jgi:hypothetical protein
LKTIPHFVIKIYYLLALMVVFSEGKFRERKSERVGNGETEGEIDRKRDTEKGRGRERWKEAERRRV